MDLIDQPARIVAQIFKGMSPEDKAKLRDDHHVLFYNLEDLSQMVDIVNESAAYWQRQKEFLTPRCTCGEAWAGHPNPHALTCAGHAASGATS